MNNSEFKVGRIKQFGPIWENKLQGLVLEEKDTVTAIAREMRCDYKTVVKYSSKLGLKAFIKTKMDLEYPSQIKRKIRDDDSYFLYKSIINDYLTENPDSTYCEIRKKFPKQFSYLYKHEKDWIEMKLTKSGSKSKVGRMNEELWLERDIKISVELKEIYLYLSNSEEKRITKTMLMRKTGKQYSIDKNMDKLPLCKEFLDGLKDKSI